MMRLSKGHNVEKCAPTELKSWTTGECQTLNTSIMQAQPHCRKALGCLSRHLEQTVSHFVVTCIGVLSINSGQIPL